MTKRNRIVHSCLLILGGVFALASLWQDLSATAGPAAQQKKRPNLMEAAQLKGRPDNAGSLAAQQKPALRGAAAAAPMPIPPPYLPVPMTAEIGWTGLVAYSNTNGVALINPSNHTISPVLLNEFDWTIAPGTIEPIGGQLGSEGGGRFDVAMTSDGGQALISNFGDCKVFFVDLRSGTPVVTGMVKIDIFAEDIAIDPTNTWALVTDGGFSARIALLHIPTRTWVPAGMDDAFDPPVPMSYTIPPLVIEDEADPDYPGYGRYANSVDIAADGRTVIVTDYFAGTVHVLLLDPATGALSIQQTVELWKYGTDGSEPLTALYRPINSAISPDGRTVLIANADTTWNPNQPYPPGPAEGCNVAVLVIDRPGHVVRMPDIIFPNSIAGGQSIVFSPDGRRAFYETVNNDEWLDFIKIPAGVFFAGQEIQVLTATGDGQFSHTGTVHTPSWRCRWQFFGVDTMAITPDGNFLYVTNPALSGASPIIDVIDLNSMSHVKQIGTPTHYPDPRRNWPDPPDPPDPFASGDWIEWVLPAGIAFPSMPPNTRPVAIIAVDKTELILDIGEKATFDGSGSYDPEKSPLTYKWSLVSAPAGAAPTLAPGGKTAVLTPDPNSEGTYQVGLVVNDGALDSTMATASVAAKFYPVLPPAGAAIQRLENSFIFYKEYVNKLTWQINPENKSLLANYRICRKTKGADDSAYVLLATLAPTVFIYEDKELEKDQWFTYKITAVNSRGKESDAVVVSN